jgi:hypothetical protein
VLRGKNKMQNINNVSTIYLLVCRTLYWKLFLVQIRHFASQVLLIFSFHIHDIFWYIHDIFWYSNHLCTSIIDAFLWDVRFSINISKLHMWLHRKNHKALLGATRPHHLCSLVVDRVKQINCSSSLN